MSYAELDRDPDKFKLMATAFTVQSAQNQFEEIVKADTASKAKVAGR